MATKRVPPKDRKVTGAAKGYAGVTWKVKDGKWEKVSSHTGRLQPAARKGKKGSSAAGRKKPQPASSKLKPPAGKVVSKKPSKSPETRPDSDAMNVVSVRNRARKDGAGGSKSGSSKDRPGSQRPALPPDLQAYVEALVAEFDATVVPAITRRLRAGADRLAPKELVKRMLAVAPAPAPTNKMAQQVGPDFYDTAGVGVVLARPGAEPISKQAVEQRRRRKTILALQTSDGRWVYPTWQFRDHEVMPHLAEVLAVFDQHSSWSVATWLTTPSIDLEGRTAVQWLNESRDRTYLMRLARQTERRWAA